MIEKTEFALVSAVITTKNRLENLKRAIDSVLSQSYPNIECIVVSDASIDGTDDYCKNRSDIRYIPIQPNESRGGNYARNLGINASKGKYVAFLDDDDAWLPEKIDKQVKLLEEKKCECVYCLRVIEKVIDGHVVSRSNEKLTYKIEGDISKNIFRHFITSTSCILATRNVLNLIGGFDEQLFKIQEYELLIRISQLTPIFYCHGNPLVIYTRNLSDRARVSNDPTKLPVARKYVDNKHKQLLKNAGLYNRLLHFDWMSTALYKSAVRSNNIIHRLKYAPYYYIRFSVWGIFCFVMKLKNTFR